MPIPCLGIDCTSRGFAASMLTLPAAIKPNRLGQQLVLDPVDRLLQRVAVAIGWHLDRRAAG